MKCDDQLNERVREWSTRIPPAEVAALADAARQRHDGVAAVLFYGSCLHSGRFDEEIADLPGGDYSAAPPVRTFWHF
jgi:hypothetical protein